MSVGRSVGRCLVRSMRLTTRTRLILEVMRVGSEQVGNGSQGYFPYIVPNKHPYSVLPFHIWFLPFNDFPACIIRIYYHLFVIHSSLISNSVTFLPFNGAKN